MTSLPALDRMISVNPVVIHDEDDLPRAPTTGIETVEQVNEQRKALSIEFARYHVPAAHIQRAVKLAHAVLRTVDTPSCGPRDTRSAPIVGSASLSISYVHRTLMSILSSMLS